MTVWITCANCVSQACLDEGINVIIEAMLYLMRFGGQENE